MRFLILFVAVFLSFSQAAIAAVFNAQTAKLDNGLQIVLIPNERAPVVTQMLWYKVGGADEPQGQSGLTHFLEHLMFKGTPSVPTGEFSKRVSEMGGHDNAFTTHDTTTYYQAVARKYLPVVMAMEADRMKNLKLSSEDIEAERKVILQERGERYDNNPDGRFWENVDTKIFEGHPYARPVIGWRKEIEKLTPQQIMAYYHQWYVPNNAVLVVSGDVTMDELLPLAKKYYGGIAPNWNLPAKTLETSVITRKKTDRMVRKDIQVQQPQWARLYPVPAYHNDTVKTADALTVIADVLGSGPTSPIYRELVVKQKIAAQANISYDGSRRGIGQLGIYVVPVAGVSAETIEKAVDNFIAEQLQTGIGNDDIGRSITRIITAADYARDSLDGPPTVIGEALADGLDLSLVETFPDRISRIECEAVNRTLQQLFNGDKAHSFYPPMTAVLLSEKTGGK